MKKEKHHSIGLNGSIIILFFTMMTSACTSQQNKNDKVTYLENEHIKIGILTDVGGRLVFLGSPDGENMLLSNPELWNEDQKDRITPNKNAHYKAYNGLITWIGPQTEWWTQQNINTQQKENAAVWPPDPWLEYGAFSIFEKSDHSITITGKESPVSGLKITKTFTLESTVLNIQVKAQNMRSTSVAWDLWSNARFAPYTPFFVPDVDSTTFKVEHPKKEAHEIMNYTIEDGNFSFITQEPNKRGNQRYTKAFIHSSKADIVALSQGNMIVIDFDAVNAKDIHPEQALIEIYNRTTDDHEESLLELEHHGAYKTLNPNEIMELNEQWHIVKMPKNATIEDCKRGYNKMIE